MKHYLLLLLGLALIFQSNTCNAAAAAVEELEPSRAATVNVQAHNEASEPISGRTRVIKFVGISDGSELYLEEASVAGDSVVKWMKLKANTGDFAAALRGSEPFLTAEGLSSLQVHLPKASDRSAVTWRKVLSGFIGNDQLTSVGIIGLTLPEAKLIIAAASIIAAAPIPKLERFFVSREKGVRVTLHPVSSGKEGTYAMGLSKTAWAPQQGAPADEEVDESDEDEDPAVPASAASSR